MNVPSSAPSIVVYLLDDVPLVRALVARLGLPPTLAATPHYAYPSEEQPRATEALAALERAHGPEPTLDAALEAEVLAIDRALVHVLVDAASVSSVRAGFRPGVTLEAFAEAHAAAGFRIERVAAFQGEEDVAEPTDLLTALRDAGLSALADYVATGAPPLPDALPEEDRRIAKRDVGTWRFGEALGPRLEAWSPTHLRILDVFVRAFPEGEAPPLLGRHGGRIQALLRSEPWGPHGAAYPRPLAASAPPERAEARSYALYTHMIARGLSRGAVLAANAYDGMGPETWASRGWLAAEQLLDLEAILGEVQVTAGREAARRVLDRWVLDVPSQLFQLRALREAIARAFASPAPELFSGVALARLVAGGSLDEATLARLPAWAERENAPRTEPRAASRTGYAIAALWGSYDPRSGAGAGVEPARFGFIDQTHVSLTRPIVRNPIVDMAWSRSGKSLAVACRNDFHAFVRGENGTRAESDAGCFFLDRVRLAGAREAHGARVLAVDFDARGLLVSGSRDGALRCGALTRSRAEHDLLATFGGPIFRVRVRPTGKEIALFVRGTLVLWRPNEEPIELARDVELAGDFATRAFAKEGADAHVAWATDGATLAICDRGEVVVWTADGVLVRRVRIADAYETHGGIAACAEGFVIPRFDALVVVDDAGRVRTIPRPLLPAEGATPRLAACSPDGRLVVAAVTSDVGLAERYATLEMFDLRERRGYLVAAHAAHPPMSPLAFAPAGDALAVGHYDSLDVYPFALDVERATYNETIRLGDALLQARHPAVVRDLCKRLPLPKGRGALRVAFTALEHGAALNLPDDAPPPPLPKAPPPRATGAAEFDLDDAVEHARFGRGIVVDVEGNGPSARVTATFDGTERVLPAASLKRAP